MATLIVSVDVTASQDFTKKLQQLNKSAFPVAVRGTLNAAAFDVKTNTLQKSAKSHFIQRAPSFWKRFSAVDRAQGFDIGAMAAAVGMTNQGVTRATTPVEQLQQQETGGAIRKGLNYLKAARAGSNDKMVTVGNWFKKDSLVKGKFKRQGGTKSSRFVASAYVALREKKKMFFKAASGQGFTIKITSISKGKKGLKITSQLISVNRDHKPINIRSTGFSREAAMETVAKMPYFYKTETEKQFAKVFGK